MKVSGAEDSTEGGYTVGVGFTAAPVPPSLTEAFEDASIHHEATLVLDMADHFSGDDLTYAVEVTTTNQRTGQERTGPLNEIARNKVTGAWEGSVLTLTGGSASPQDLTLTITATGVDDATVSDAFTLSLTAVPPPADPPPADPPPADPPPEDPDSDPATLIEEFDDLTLSDDETHDLDMAVHFSGDGLTFVVEVTTTNQRTGQLRTGLLNEIARNKLGG